VIVKNALESPPRFFIGLDVGGTKVEGMVVDVEGNIAGQSLLPMDASSAERAVESIIVTIQQVMKSAGLESNQVCVAGIGIPGQVENGMVRMAVNLNMDHVPLAETLGGVFDMPFVLENDVRAAALGAYDHYNAIHPIQNLAYISIGTGISAGLILEGRLYRGSNGMAGEIGHAVIDPCGPECKCGMRGCLEIVASGSAIAAQARQTVELGVETLMADMQPLDARAVYAAHALGDLAASRIVQQESSYLAQNIQWMIMAYDVDKLVIGGGVSHDGQGFLEPILEELARLRGSSELGRRLLSEEKIALFPKDVNAGLLGAIALAKQKYQFLERRW
jgi:glucokinase